MQAQGHVGRTSPPLIAGYLPLLVVCVVIVAMVWLVPSDVPADGSAAGPSGGGSGGGPAEVGSDEVGTTATGWGDSVQPCGDRERQDDVLVYAPPCFTFSGDNGGETAVGVTEDTIRVSYRHLAETGHFVQTMSDLAGSPLGESPEDLWDTTEALVEYVNEHFEFFGREIELVRFDGSSHLLNELLGAGQEGASTDARRATDEHVFADITSFSQPYAEQLVNQEVVTIGAPYMSRGWFEERAPYAWSSFPDCTLIAERSADLMSQQVLDNPVIFGPHATEERVVGVVYPSNEQYRICGEHFQQRLVDAGLEIPEPQTYPLDISNTAENASSILDGLQRDDVNVVSYAGDPMMLDALVSQAESQGFEPEWLVAGVGYVDLDLVGQLVAGGAGDQWSRAFGVASSGTPLPIEEMDAYAAFRSVRPDGEPSVALDFLYANVIRLAIGIQMAGPDLTPASFGDGMFRYPATDGWMGLMDYGPENYAGLADSRLMVWAPDHASPFNGEPGTWADDGSRFQEMEDAPAEEDLIEVQGAQQ